MDKQDNFLDSKTLIAIALVGLVWVGWQQYLTSKYGTEAEQAQTAEQTAAQTSEQTTSATNTETSTSSTNTTTSPTQNVAATTATPETKLPIQSDVLTANLSSKGMAIQDATLLQYTDRENNSIKVGTNESFAIYAIGSKTPLDFKITQNSEKQFVGTAQVGQVQIQQVITFNEDKYSFKSEIEVRGRDQNFTGLVVQLPERKFPFASSSFFTPSFDAQDVFVRHNGKSERYHLAGSTEKMDHSVPAATILATGTQYFVSAIKDNSSVLPEAQTNWAPASDPTQHGYVNSRLIYNLANTADVVSLNFTGFVGPTSFGLLKSVDAEFTEIIDFGFFGAIAKILLQLLQWFHKFLGNWGLAIIFLTLLVRLVVMPFNISSYHSMKRMQKVQPAMQALRAKHKDDPQALNREMMVFMKENKVNPVGGCLPMLLQMPIFFALFQVLRSSVDLYKAPFFGWITDLSIKDPFYVLPVLMGICMFLQSKLTPNTMPPEQAKIMQFLPLVFALMMIAFPSGLNLYMFVSTLFAVIQQQLFMKDKSAAGANNGKKTGLAEKMTEA